MSKRKASLDDLAAHTVCLPTILQLRRLGTGANLTGPAGPEFNPETLPVTFAKFVRGLVEHVEAWTDLDGDCRGELREHSQGVVCSHGIDGLTYHDVALQLAQRAVGGVLAGLRVTETEARADGFRPTAGQMEAAARRLGFIDAREVYRLQLELQRERGRFLADGGEVVAPDDSVWISVSDLYPERFENYGACKRYLNKHSHEIRTDKPSPQRLVVHAGDWLKHWANADKGAFDSLDRKPELVDGFMAGIEKRKAKIRKKRPQK